MGCQGEDDGRFWLVHMGERWAKLRKVALRVAI